MRNSTPSDVPSLVSGFLDEHLVGSKGLSPKTVAVYADSLMLFLRYVSDITKRNPDRLDFRDFTSETVLGFLQHLETERGNTVRSRNLRLSALKSFFGYAGWKHGVLLDQASRLLLIPGKRYQRGLVSFLSIEEIKVLLDTPEKTTVAGIRDRAMLLFTYAYGLRVSEAVGLCLDDLWLGRNPNMIIYGKGGTKDEMPLLPDHVNVMKAWLAVRPKVPAPNVFLNQEGDALTRDGCAYVVSKYARLASIACPSIARKRVTPHVLRHSCAMAILKATKDSRKAAKHLRHASYATIEAYLHADPDEKLETLTAHPSLDIQPGKFAGRATGVMARLEAARGRDGLAGLPRPLKPIGNERNPRSVYSRR